MKQVHLLMKSIGCQSWVHEVYSDKKPALSEAKRKNGRPNTSYVYFVKSKKLQGAE